MALRNYGMQRLASHWASQWRYKFADYDPARVDTWKESNRPWDYNHILPSARLYNKRGKDYKTACDAWVNTIGNLRAWPLELNRSKSNDSNITEEQYKDSFIINSNECEAFSSEKIADNPKDAVTFVNTARSRMLRIYTDWFEKLDIAKLLKQE